MAMKMEMAAMVEHVAAFVRILNASQSKELHEWTIESLERVFSWAKIMETIAEKAKCDGNEATAGLEQALVRHLQGAALPSPQALGGAITVSTLQNATRYVCDAVLTSPWLHSHPRRPELATPVFQKLTELKGSSLASHSDLFVQQIQARQSREAMRHVADVLGRGCKPTRVQVCSKVFEVQSLAGYQLEQRSLRLKSLARTLQANVCVAQRVSESHEASDGVSTLTRVEDQLRQGNKDVVETIVWCVVLDWPSDHAVVHSKMVTMVESWLFSQTPSSMFSLEPWLAAMFASKSAAFSRRYLDVLLRSGLRLLDCQDLRSRIGALVLHGATLQDEVEAHINQLDIVSREQLLSYIIE